MVYFEGAIQGFSLIQSFYFSYNWEIPIGSSFPVELQALCLLFWWKWALYYAFLKYFFYFTNLCVKRRFGGIFHSDCFIISVIIFIFNLKWKESFLESTFRGWIFDEYLILHQLFIKHQLYTGNLERFHSQMSNLLT